MVAREVGCESRGEGVDGLMGKGVGLIEFRQQSESQRRVLRFIPEATSRFNARTFSESLRLLG